MPLRTHQQEFGNVIAGIINGSGVRNIVAHVTPGGGKSTLPIQAGRLIPESTFTIEPLNIHGWPGFNLPFLPFRSCIILSCMVYK